MRKNSVLSYLLSDHLGSTSLVTDSTGAVISEVKYKAWGEVRYASGTTLTNYTYTGQYSYVSDFGLMFYNARWYDPSLGRFAQADTIVPGGGQGVDRYAYVNNSPMNYTDPSGHYAQCQSIYCSPIYQNSEGKSSSSGGGGLSDEDFKQLIDAIENGAIQMGDVIAYDLLGETSYAMFAEDPFTNNLVLWDMTGHTTISMSQIQQSFIGLYQFEPSSGDFELNSFIGNSSYATQMLGETIEFQDFPAGWAGGTDNHVRYSQQMSIQCGEICLGVAGVSLVPLEYELAKGLMNRTLLSGVNPYMAGLSLVTFAVDMALNFEPTNPYVVLIPGPDPTSPPNIETQFAPKFP